MLSLLRVHALNLSSSCGYSTGGRQVAHTKSAQGQKSKSTDDWKRAAPYNFTACLAHADITYHASEGHILRVMGVLEHNVECVDARLVRKPAVPLHEHVIEVALEQLRAGAR